MCVHHDHLRQRDAPEFETRSLSVLCCLTALHVPCAARTAVEDKKSGFSLVFASYGSVRTDTLIYRYRKTRAYRKDVPHFLFFPLQAGFCCRELFALYHVIR